MKYAAASVWALVVVLGIVNGVRSGSSGLGLAYGLAALLGGAGVIVYLRTWAARRARELAAEVESGRSLWAAQVRELVPRARWGADGRLLVRPDSSVDLRPDASSLRRGAEPRSWGPGAAQIALTQSRRDITGIRYEVLELSISNHDVRRFAAFDIAGILPATTKAPNNRR